MLDPSYDRRLRRTLELAGGGSGVGGAATSPTASPTKASSTRNTMGDRLVPTRAGNNWHTAFHMKVNRLFFFLFLSLIFNESHAKPSIKRLPS